MCRKINTDQNCYSSKVNFNTVFILCPCPTNHLSRFATLMSTIILFWCWHISTEVVINKQNVPCQFLHLDSATAVHLALTTVWALTIIHIHYKTGMYRQNIDLRAWKKCHFCHVFKGWTLPWYHNAPPRRVFLLITEGVIETHFIVLDSCHRIFTK